MSLVNSQDDTRGSTLGPWLNGRSGVIMYEVKLVVVDRQKAVSNRAMVS